MGPSDGLGNLQKNGEKVVAHINSTFFAGSETFIYHYVSHHKRFKPACLAFAFENKEQFAFPAEDLLSISHRRYTPAWAYFGVRRRLFRTDPWLTKQLKRSGCCIIHAHFGPMGCYALSSKKALGIPLVTTFYGFDLFEEEIIERYRKKYLKLFRGGEMFLVEGPSTPSFIK